MRKRNVRKIRNCTSTGLLKTVELGVSCEGSWFGTALAVRDRTTRRAIRVVDWRRATRWLQSRFLSKVF